jgi:Dolichyl-phosphate-mannose-protein mannosyltransferase
VDAPDQSDASAEPGPAARRLDFVLLAAALALALALGLLNVGAPWENGFKGTNGAAYTYRFLQHHLELGLSVTRGACVKAVDPRTHELVTNLNHPATYNLLQLPAAALFGLSEAVVRVVALLLYLPAVPALWWLARRLLGAPAAGACALFFASTPLVAYYAPMAVADGPLLAAFVLVATAFLAHVDTPTRATRWLLGLSFFGGCLLDWNSAFLAPLLLLLLPATRDRRRAARVLLGLLPLGALAVALLFAHTAFIVRGVDAAGELWLGLFQFSQEPHAPWAVVLGAEALDGLALVGPLRLLLAGAGLGVAVALRGDARMRRAAGVGLVLLVPGALNVLAFPKHALVHSYWGLFALPGVALLAALPLAAAWRARGTAARAVAALLLALVGYLAVDGARATGGLVQLNATTLHRDVGALLDEHFGPGDVVASSVLLNVSDVYTRATIVGPITTPGQARLLAADYAPPAFTGQLAFLLPRHERDSPLARTLAQMGTLEPLPNMLLFHVRR